MNLIISAEFTAPPSEVIDWEKKAFFFYVRKERKTLVIKNDDEPLNQNLP